jgi:hypothetical protein
MAAAKKKKKRSLFCAALVAGTINKLEQSILGLRYLWSHVVFAMLNVVVLGVVILTVVMLTVVILSGVGLNVVAPTTHNVRGKLFRGKKFLDGCRCSNNEPNYHYGANDTKLYFQQCYIFEE